MTSSRRKSHLVSPKIMKIRDIVATMSFKTCAFGSVLQENCFPASCEKILFKMGLRFQVLQVQYAV